MAYTWLGMRVFSKQEVDDLYKLGELKGCYRLYPDGTEAQIDEITLYEVVEHYNAGGEFGEEHPTVELNLWDGKKIIAPEVVDVSKMGCLDELDYSMWNTIQEYFSLFGIRTEDDDPDWATVKSVQDHLIELLTDVGVHFQFNTKEQQELINKAFEEKEADKNVGEQ